MKRLLQGVGVVVLVVVGVGLFLPSDFEIVRQQAIDAHPIQVHVNVGLFDNWPAWWPWDDLPPEKKFIFSKPTSGVGASIELLGRPASTKLTITAASPTGGIEFRYQHAGQSRPSSGAILYAPTSRGTLVTWQVRGHYEIPVLGGYLAAIADSMFGGMLEHGLANLKRALEADKRELFFEQEDSILKQQYDEMRRSRELNIE